MKRKIFYCIPDTFDAEILSPMLILPPEPEAVAPISVVFWIGAEVELFMVIFWANTDETAVAPPMANMDPNAIALTIANIKFLFITVIFKTYFITLDRYSWVSVQMIDVEK